MQTSHDNNRIIISEDKILKRGYQDDMDCIHVYMMIWIVYNIKVKDMVHWT